MHIQVQNYIAVLHFSVVRDRFMFSNYESTIQYYDQTNIRYYCNMQLCVCVCVCLCVRVRAFRLSKHVYRTVLTMTIAYYAYV